MGKIDVPKSNVLLVSYKILLIIAGLILVGTIGISLHSSFQESLSKTISIFTHTPLEEIEGEPSIILKALIIGLAVIGEVILFYLIYVLIDLIVKGKLKIALREVMSISKAKKMRGHYIICGGGRVGARVATELETNKKQVIIIEKHEEKAEELLEKGFNVLQDNTMEYGVLEKAGVKQAEGFITALGSDAENIFLILEGRELNNDLVIGTRANNEAAARKMKKAGADYIVLPEQLGAIRLSNEMLGKKA